MEFFVNGKKVRYNPYHMKKDKFLGSGFELSAYQINNKAVKFFGRYPRKAILLTKESIEKMKNIGTKRILLPTDALLDKKHKLRGYEMDYVEDLGSDNYFGLDKKKLGEESEILREDINQVSDHNLLIDDLDFDNTVYHNGLYLIDPGSYEFDGSKDKNQVYNININIVNHYLIYEVLRRYYLEKHSKLNNRASYDFSREVDNEYNKSSKNDVLEFLSDIEEDNLSQFVERRVNKH